MHKWTKQTKGAGISNMIMQKLERCDAINQLDIWKKVSQAKTKEKKKVVRRQVRLGQSEQDKHLQETYQRGRKVRRCQRSMSRGQTIM